MRNELVCKTVVLQLIKDITPNGEHFLLLNLRA